MYQRLLAWIILFCMAACHGPAPSARLEEYSTTAQPYVKGRQLMLGDEAFAIRAICWNPVRKGASHPDGLLFRYPSAEDLQVIDKDLQLMKSLGANTLRTYEAIRDERVLALVEKYQLRLIVPVFNYYLGSMDAVDELVNFYKDKNQVLFWEIGNEWNYNQFYSVGKADIGLDRAKRLIKTVIQHIRSIDPYRPISTVHGELPSRELVQELSGIDIWGLNVYSGISFGDRFAKWNQLSEKPMYFAEYGADALNGTLRDEASQALAVVALTREITDHLSANSAFQVSLGGAIFEWNDEWWKDDKGAADIHNEGGQAPGSGPFPDMVFNEEWFGLVDIDRQPRKVLQDLQSFWAP